VRTLIPIVNQKKHSELFKEIDVRISKNPDEIIARNLYLWSKNPNTNLLAFIEGCSIFETRVCKGAKGLSKTAREISDTRDMLYITIQRNRKLIIPSGNVTFQFDDIITIFIKKEAESKSIEYMNNLFH
jgi:trk system potassium uptake protein TrkA